MKLLAKPISSPGRAEKFPPPLMRFLRSNVGSKSRGRSRSSPLFFRKKNTVIETQEPSSPKVTCMGQVRVRRSKKSCKTPARHHRNSAPTRLRRFKRIRNALFCRPIGWKLKAKAFRPSWPKWVFSFHWCSLCKPKIREDSSRIESNLGSKIKASVRETEEETDEDYEEESKVFASSPSSPPKNALLLTRCRSAPYRSSSLAGRFWGSPLSTEETKPEPEPEETRTEPENGESDNPTSERESSSRDSDQESKTDPETEEKSGFLNQFEEKIVKSADSEEPKAEELSTVRPLILTRCRTVPARTAAKLDPDLTLWKKRRIDFT